MIHVASSRLIRCGVDGLYRGELQLENLDEKRFLHIPIDCDPILRSPTLLTWIQSCLRDPFLLSEPIDWFFRAQQTHYTSIRPQSEI